MAINFDKALGIHQQSLLVRARRSALITSNLANSDTPGYKARDIDFKAELAKASGQTNSLQLKQSNNAHLPIAGSSTADNALYREPLHSSLDGNTVDAEMERVRFSENAIRYQANLTFLSRKFSGLKNAIRSE